MTRRNSGVNRSLVAGLGMAMICTACPRDGSPPKAGGKELEAEISKLPPGFKLNLPIAPIAAPKSQIATMFPDGSHSISGLLTKRATLIGKEVTVTGVLLEVKVPKTTKPGEKFTPAHLFVADVAAPSEGQPRLLVADFDAEQVADLDVGKRYRFSGQYQMTSSSRFSRTEGVLSFKAVAAIH